MQCDDVKLEMVKSRRKTISIEIKSSSRIIVRVPLYMSERDALDFVREHRSWIDRNLSKAKSEESIRDAVPKMTMSEVREMADEAMKILPPKVEKYAKILNVTYGRITVRNQKTRWGSCSSKGNLNFNCALVRCPEKVIDYIVIHELCHRIYMNHSKAFYNAVSSVMPDYKECEKWIKEKGKFIISAMP